MNANSARFQKTDEAIREAFWTLLREKGFYQLRATDIIKTAGVNRSTFYEHYLDKYDLVERIEDEFLNELICIAECGVPALAEGGVPRGNGGAEFSRKMVDWLSRNGEKFVLLMKSDGSPGFTKKLKQRVQQFWDRHSVSSDPVGDRYARAAVLGFLTGLLNEWVDSGLEYSPEQFYDVFTEAMVPLYGYIMRHCGQPPREDAAAAETISDNAAMRGHSGGPAPVGDSAFLEGKIYSERRGVYDYGE